MLNVGHRFDWHAVLLERLDDTSITLRDPQYPETVFFENIEDFATRSVESTFDLNEFLAAPGPWFFGQGLGITFSIRKGS